MRLNLMTLIVDLAHFRDRKAARRALDKAYAKALLQQGDPAAQLRLRHSDRAAGDREPPIFNHLSEEEEVVEVLHRRSRRIIVLYIGRRVTKSVSSGKSVAGLCAFLNTEGFSLPTLE